MAEPYNFWVRIDMHELEIMNFRVENLAADPGTPPEGLIWHNTVAGESRIRTTRGVTSINRAIIADDDDFHNRLNTVTTKENTDMVMIWDSSASPIDHQSQYRQISLANLLSGIGTVNNAYYRIQANAGVSPLDASGESALMISGDGTKLRTVGSTPGVNTVSIEWLVQSPHAVLVGPSSGGSAIPTFRALQDTDMPVSYNPTSWDTAYTHSQVSSGNPHSVTMAELGFSVVTTVGDPGSDFSIPTEQAVREFVSGGGFVFSSDIFVVLSGGKSLGKYTNGETIPAIGKNIEEILNDIALEYISPVFNSFSINGQATTVEVGTTLSGSKTFLWDIDENSGDVNVIDIYDITDASYIATDTANDGSEAVTINTNQLNSESAAQSWRGIGTDVTPDPDVDFNSSAFTVTAYFYRFYGPTASSPTDSASVRALPSSDFQTGSDVFILNTGNTLTKFSVCLPPGHTIASVIDLDALGADITSEYVAQTSINVNDAGGTPRAYNIYEMNMAIPYTTSHRHQITTG